jgi:choice-of-anchor C domain-containing protein
MWLAGPPDMVRRTDMRYAVLAGVCLMMAGSVGRTADETEAKNLVVNGSFEDGPEVPSDPGWVTLEKDANSVKGWVVSRGTVDFIGSYWKAADGKGSLDMNGNDVGGIKQTIATVKGKKYKLTFQLAGNPAAEPRMKELTVEVGTTKKAFSFDTTGKSLEDMGWKLQELEFTADDDKTTLEFYSTTGDTPCGPALDDVKVVAVK